LEVPVSPWRVIRNLATNPWEYLITRWNWKSALFSSIFRALIFFFSNLTAGWRAATGAMLAEFVYRALTTGFYGAITQAFREAEPPWLAMLVAIILLPVFSHSLELCVHLLRGTPKLVTSIVASFTFTVLSTLFMLYAMRRGSFIVGADARSLSDDMANIPKLLLAFLVCGPRGLISLLRSFAGNRERCSPAGHSASLGAHDRIGPARLAHDQFTVQ
jgi:hypothetical protein